MKTLCLAMIIKNESAIIQRCLDSVRSICDFMVICDTGSTDGTQELVRGYFAEHHILGTLCEHTWKNFGHNRTLSIQEAKKTGADYILTIDADMMMQVLPTFDKSLLIADSYSVAQRSSVYYYFNTRIMRATLDWNSVGVTHEYWSAEGKLRNEELTGLIIDDLDDGGCKADKFERDVQLLTQGLIDEPENERYMFYLAQSYKALDQYDKALEWYRKCMSANGWKQEVWYCKYMIGYCHEEKDEWPLALAAYLEAYNFAPSRAEPLYAIVSHYRKCGLNVLARDWCHIAMRIPFPNGRPLFCETKVYVSGLLYEQSIFSYYVKEHFRGLIACEQLLHDCVPWKSFAGTTGRLKPNEVFGTQSNRLFYLKALSPTKSRRITFPLGDGWNLCNPAILMGGEYMTVRSVNYKLDTTNGKYHPGTNGKVNTRTYILDNNNSRRYILQEAENAQVPTKFPSSVEDYEDVRMFFCQGNWYGIATSREMNAKTTPEMVLLHFLPETNLPPHRIHKVVRLRGHEDHKTQKNWMPFVHNDQPLLVYMCEPLTILQPNLETGQVTITQMTPNPWWCPKHYRGGSGGVAWQDGFLFLVHEVAFPYADDDRRVYTHRFIFLSRSEDQWCITRISQPFWFFHKGVEFVVGMARTSDTTLEIGVGKNDCEAWIVSVELSDVNRWLTHGDLLRGRPAPPQTP